MQEGMTFVLAMGFNVFFLSYLVKFFSDWTRLKYKNRMYNQLLSKINSTQDLTDFLTAEGSSDFLNRLIIRDIPIKEKVLSAYSRGIVIACGGSGLLITGWLFTEYRKEFLMLGILAVALGVGFLLSTVFSHRMSQKWGLLD